MKQLDKAGGSASSMPRQNPAPRLAPSSGVDAARRSRRGLLLGGALLFGGSWLSAAGCGSGDECSSEVSQQARKVLETYCYRCHGQSEPVMAGLNVLDVSGMIARGTIIPGAAEDAPLYHRAADGQMPPPGDEPRPGEQEIADLRSWIACGASDFNQIEGRSFVTIEAALRDMGRDLEAIDASERKLVRYFVMTHLYNAGVDDATLDVHRRALFKMVNSLSRAKEAIVPVAVDAPRNTIYRVVLTDYRWEARPQEVQPQDLWSVLVASYPYGVVYANSPDTELLQSETGAAVPWLFADWFVNAASTPPLYHQMLRSPVTVAELEAELDVSTASDLANRNVARAGFNDSGVSSNHRVIERYDTQFGPYWKSYDCASSVGKCDIFNRPIGPPALGAPPGAAEFTHDGGELIFSLPNGLHGYMITDALGTRIDAAPISIVFDASQRDATVRSGRSCMGCHREGIILKDDMVREFVLGNQSLFDPAVIDLVQDIYPPKDALRKLQEADRAAYVAALKASGVPGVAVEPVRVLASNHDQSLTLRRAAAELWMTRDAVLEAISGNPLMASGLGSLAVGQAMKRDVFKAAFPQIVCALGVAAPIAFGAPVACDSSSCIDGIQNGAEAGVDCGGVCAPCGAKGL